MVQVQYFLVGRTCIRITSPYCRRLFTLIVEINQSQASGSEMREFRAQSPKSASGGCVYLSPSEQPEPGHTPFFRVEGYTMGTYWSLP